MCRKMGEALSPVVPINYLFLEELYVQKKALGVEPDKLVTTLGVNSKNSKPRKKSGTGRRGNVLGVR